MKFPIEEYKDKLTVELMKADWNEDFLKDKPHTMVGDLAIAYKVLLKETDRARHVFYVTNEMCRDTDQLHAWAMKSAPEIDPPVIKNMQEMLGSMGVSLDPGDDKPQLMVVTNKRNQNGAAAVFYPGIMSRITEIAGGSYWIIPSSVHEMLIWPGGTEGDADRLKEIIQEVNEHEVSPENRLSDRVYHYDAERKLFEIAR